MFGRSGVINDSKFRLLAALDDAGQRPTHYPQRIGKQGAVGWMVDIGFYGGSISAQLFSGDHCCLSGLLNDPLVELLSTLLAKERESRNRVLIKAREAPIQKAGSQLAVKLAIRPTFEVLEHRTA